MGKTLPLAEDTLWKAVIGNDAAFDGSFVYAVKTTGVFCRPSCASRRPNRENVVFFDTPDEAVAAGFRPCKRCHSSTAFDPCTVDTLKKACEYIIGAEQTPTLASISLKVGLSAAHFQRLFTEALGISPRQFADAVRQKRLRGALQSGDDILGALYDAGYGSTSRVYEFSNRYLGMTPATYRRGGRGLRIWYTIVRCPLGHLLVATTEKGVCSVQLGDSKTSLKKNLRDQFREAEIMEYTDELNAWAQALVDYLAEKRPWPVLPYDVRATAFQRRVWDHLRTIPPGRTCNYAEVAEAIGRPTSARAVARACASNPVALVVPCHRVVPKAGGVGGYRWSPARKRKLLELESGSRPGKP